MDIRALHYLHRGVGGCGLVHHTGGRRLSESLGERFGPDDRALREDGCALKRILELPHIPGPIVRLQQILRFWRELEPIPTPLSHPRKEVMRENRNVISSIPERG